VFATFDQVATYEQPAVAQSSSKVKIIGTDGLPPNLDSIRTGKAQIADVAFVPPAYMAWLSLDQVARARKADRCQWHVVHPAGADV